MKNIVKVPAAIRSSSNKTLAFSMVVMLLNAPNKIPLQTNSKRWNQDSLDVPFVAVVILKISMFKEQH